MNRSDNGEVNIPYVNNELDVDSIETHCAGTDCFIKTWFNQGTEGATYDATQTTNINQPKVWDSVSGMIMKNGTPAIQCDSTIEGLDISTINFTGESYINHYVVYSRSKNENVRIGGHSGGQYILLDYPSLSRFYMGGSGNKIVGLPALGSDQLLIIYNIDREADVTDLESAINFYYLTY